MKLLPAEDLDRIAQVLDTRATYGIRTVGSTPEIRITSTDVDPLEWLSERTGIGVAPIKGKANSRRWTATGTRALIILEALRDRLHARAGEVASLVDVGLQVRAKPHIIEDMRLHGWRIPDYLL